MILLKNLKLNNFLSHEKTEISFSENEKLLIDGRSGSGKSSITEAILWGLYGEGRSDGRSLIRRGSKTASVSLKLTVGELSYVVTRTVSGSGKNTLIVTRSNGGGPFVAIERTGIKDTQDWIEKELLKASYELFTNSVAYPQENENSFVKANAGRRKDLLLEIVRAGNFDELYDKSRKAITANELESAVVYTKIESLESTVKTYKEVADTHASWKEKLDFADFSLKGFILTEKDLESQANKISSIRIQISDKNAIGRMKIDRVGTIDRRIESDEKEISDHKNIDIQTARDNLTYAGELDTEAQNIEAEIKKNNEKQQKINVHLANKPQVFDYTKDLEMINKRLIPLITDTHKCPAGDKCPFIVPIQSQIDFLTEQITEKTAKQASEKSALAFWEAMYVQLVPAREITELYTKLKDVREHIKILEASKVVILQYDLAAKRFAEMEVEWVKLKKEKADLSAELLTLNAEIKVLEETSARFNANQINGDLAKIRIEIQMLQKTRDEANMGVNMAVKAVVVIEESEKTLKELQKGIAMSQENKEALELLKEALSPRGVKAVVIDYIVPQLEDRINAVLGQLSDFRIRLDTQKALADEEGVKEGLFITVINDRGEELSFDNYSGGEKVKITISISEALASLMNQIGFRIMDENIVSLDRESTEGFVEVLTKLQEKFPQLLVISHLQEVKDIFEKQIMITKIGGVSSMI